MVGPRPGLSGVYFMACLFAYRYLIVAASREVWHPALDAAGAHDGTDSAKGRGCLPEVHRIHSDRA